MRTKIEHDSAKGKELLSFPLIGVWAEVRLYAIRAFRRERERPCGLNAAADQNSFANERMIICFIK